MQAVSAKGLCEVVPERMDHARVVKDERRHGIVGLRHDNADVLLDVEHCFVFQNCPRETDENMICLVSPVEAKERLRFAMECK